MALFDNQINLASKDLQADINELASSEKALIVASVNQLQATLEDILDGYTIQIKFVKNSK